MSREEHAAILAAILGAGGDTAVVSENVTKLTEDYGGLIAHLAVQEAELVQLRADKASLIEQNMKLFLKVTGTAPDSPATEEPGIPSFESLFDENGMLK